MFAKYQVKFITRTPTQVNNNKIVVVVCQSVESGEKISRITKWTLGEERSIM